MEGEKKICPLPSSEGDTYHDCIGPTCAWWAVVQTPKGGEMGCAIQFLPKMLEGFIMERLFLKI